METLDKLFNQEQNTVNLTDMFPPSLTGGLLPEGALRDKASKLSVLTSGVDDILPTYQSLIAEGTAGSNILMSSLEQKVKDKNNTVNTEALTKILSDPQIPITDKKAALVAFNNSKALKDTTTTVLTESTISPSDTDKAEPELVRESLTKLFGEVHERNAAIQGIVNAHAAGLQNTDDDRIFMEAMETAFVPLANNKIVGQVFKDIKKSGEKPTLFSFLKGYVLAGGSKAELANSIANLPPKESMAFAKLVSNSIKSNTSAIFSSDNQYAQYQLLNDIFDQGGYGSGMQFLDNILPLLEVIGLGGAVNNIIRSVSKVGKTATTEKAIIDVSTKEVASVNTPVKPQTSSGSIFEARTVPTPDPVLAKQQKVIQGLEGERASILGDSSQLLDKGQVKSIQEELKNLQAPNTNTKEFAKQIQATEKMSYKDALKEAEKRIANEMADYNATKTRLQDQLTGNSVAFKNEQRLAELDKKIQELKKGMPDEAGSEITALADAISRIEWNGVVRTHNPSAVGNLMGLANPGSARSLHVGLMNSPSDEFAKAMFGTTRTEAMASNLFPQATQAKGAVFTKTTDINRKLRAGVNVDESILNTVKSGESLGLTPGEKAAIKANVVNDFRNAEGMTLNEAMSSFTSKDTGGRFTISATYGTTEGGFLRAEDAVRQAQLALRKYGVAEDDITVMQRVGSEHHVVDKNNIPDGDGEYYVRVDTNHGYDITDPSILEALDVKRNIFDRIPAFVSNKIGSVNRNLIDAAGTLNPVLTRAASVASDRTANLDKLLLNLANDYAEAWKKLSVKGKQAVENYILEANFQGIKYDQTDLISRGMNFLDRDAVQKWRKFWDTHYYLENLDMVKTLNNTNYGLLETSNARLFAREIPKNRNINSAYDATLDKVVTLSPQQIDDLYNQGGTLTVLRRPETIQGTPVEHAIARNNASEYVRKVTDRDSVLNYKDGYFQIQYKAPKFVDKSFVDQATGRRITKAVAVAGDSVEAEHFAARMRTTDPNSVYTVRSDDRVIPRGSDDAWDLNSASGRIAQRHRGKLLEDSSGLNHLGDNGYITDPVESAIRAARSISGRTMSRDMLENAKTRFVQQYGRFLQEESGVTRFPDKVDKIQAKGVFTTKDIADARTTWEYINYLENGYLNAADHAVKALFNLLGETAGSVAKSTEGIPVIGSVATSVERGVNRVAEGGGLTSLAKNAVFTAYIGTNPLRQLIMQPNQVLRLWGYSGRGLLGILETTNDVVGAAAGIKPISKDLRELWDFIQETGMLASVDRSNLVRGALVDAADLSNPIARAAGKITNFPRKIGFDIGEQVNLTAHLIASYKKYEKLGYDMKNFDVRAMVQAEARAVSYEMNFAGDMPYNQGTFSFALQFLQVPHKAWIQLTNRKIDRATRARMAATDMLLWGPPTAVIATMYGLNNNEFLPDHPDLKETVVDGLQSHLYNAAFRNMIPDQGKIDFSAFDPHDISGWKKFYEAVMTGGMSAVISNSSSGQLFLKDGGRLQNVFSIMTRFFNPIDDEETNPERAWALMLEAAKLSSGFSNAFKAKQLLEAGRRLDQYGKQTQEKATKLDALAQLFGFGSYDAAKLMQMSTEGSKDKKKLEEEMTKQYNEIKRYYTERLGQGNTDVEWMTAVSGWIVKAHADDPQAQKFFYDRMKMDMFGTDTTLLRQLMQSAGHPKTDDVRFKIDQAPISPEDKAKLIQMLNDAQAYRDENKQIKGQ